MIVDVPYSCPACGNKDSLHLNSRGGMIHCLQPGCPNPGALHKILRGDNGPGVHAVTMHDAFWSAEHPLIERVDGTLHECGIEDVISLMRESGVDHGAFIVRTTYDADDSPRHVWEEVGELVHQPAELNTSESLHGE